MYYIDATTFTAATVVCTDPELLTPAPDGYYSINGLVRQQLNGVLQFPVACPDCKGYEKPVEGELLLDLYPGAVAAYSLRLLDTAYTGDVIRVRRASDSAEQDIGFDVDGDLDTSALATFCAGTNGFVTTWYDQSGGGNDATQTTTANQPKIYDSVTGVDLDNAKPSISYDTTDILQASIAISHVPLSVFIVQSGPATQADITFDLGTTSSGLEYTRLQSNAGAGQVQQIVVRSVANGIASTSVSDDFDQGLVTIISRAVDDRSIGVNGGTFVNLSTSVTTVNSTFLKLGGQPTEQIKQQEIILYPSDQSANRAAIEANINEFYGIYWDGSQLSLLDSYPSAAVAYSLRALNSAYTGPLIRVRRASDNAEQNILATYDGELNVNALAAFCAGTNGFIVRWYDQSGSGNDAVQATTANQPKIYDSATGVVTENGKPAFETDGTDDVLTTAGVNCASNFQLALVGATLSGGFGYFTNLASSDDGIEILNFGTSYRFSIEGNDDTIAITLGNQSVAMFAYDGTSKIYSINGTENVDALTTTVSVSAGLEFGKRIGSSPVNAVYQEFVLWNSDTHISNRAAIEANINAFYSIY